VQIFVNVTRPVYRPYAHPTKFVRTKLLAITGLNHFILSEIPSHRSQGKEPLGRRVRPFATLESAGPALSSPTHPARVIWVFRPRSVAELELLDSY
jgi:hypothetical protein